LGAEEKFNLINYLDMIDISKGPTVIQSKVETANNFISSFSLGERTRSFLKVQDGCDYTCSFCTIPQARGGSRSESIQKTMKVAKQVACSNVREIVLTGVNLGDFGKGTSENFLDLIMQLDTLTDIDRIRISSIEPNLLNDEIILFCLNSDKFVPHFHIPLQSGSNKILKMMRRRYNKEAYKERISLIKSINPEACIGVDVIVGFPGESDDDFLETYHFLNDLDISYLHVFTYSERSKTDALKIKETVPKEKRAERSRMLHVLSDKKKRFFYNQFINKIRPVLFESLKNGKLIGHTDNYIQVEIEGSKDLINTIQQVRLLKNNGKSIQGLI
jgi:threonylcarbamoyladenosine tRNA methylthiotransferase MtaB